MTRLDLTRLDELFEPTLGVCLSRAVGLCLSTGVGKTAFQFAMALLLLFVLFVAPENGRRPPTGSAVLKSCSGGKTVNGRLFFL